MKWLTCFIKVLNLFLHALTIPVYRDILHTAVRQYLHRMIICLGEEVLPYIPVAVTHLLKDCEVMDDYVITYYKDICLLKLNVIVMGFLAQLQYKEFLKSSLLRTLKTLV